MTISRPISRPMKLFAAAVLLGLAAGAQARATEDAQPSVAPAAGAPAPLVVYFNSASTRVRPQDDAVLDHASRLYNEGKPIVMVITGATDAVGRPDQNLILSQQRADIVLRELIARGIPVNRFQLLAKGETEPAVATAQGVAELRNRRVEITWR